MMPKNLSSEWILSVSQAQSHFLQGTGVFPQQLPGEWRGRGKVTPSVFAFSYSCHTLQPATLPITTREVQHFCWAPAGCLKVWGSGTKHGNFRIWSCFLHLFFFSCGWLCKKIGKLWKNYKETFSTEKRYFLLEGRVREPLEYFLKGHSCWTSSN